MVWSALGSNIILTWNWQAFDLPDVGNEVFRVTSFVRQGVIYPNGYFMFSWLYDGVGRQVVRKIYPDSQPTVFSSPIPEYLRERGHFTRYASIKLSQRAYMNPSNPWIIKVEFETPIPP